MKTFLSLWKIEFASRLPHLRRDMEDAVFLPPRLAYGLYNAFVLLYWTGVAAGTITWLACRFTFLLGANTRRVADKYKLLPPKAKKPTIQPQIATPRKPSEQIPLVQPTAKAEQKIQAANTDSEQIPLVQPTAKAEQKIQAANTDMVVLEQGKIAETPLAIPPMPAEKIPLAELTTAAAEKVKAANPHMLVLARPWGKGWRIAVLEPDQATSIEHPWKVVVRS
jgi:hypothetical protein